jgi:hypothetical protein
MKFAIEFQEVDEFERALHYYDLCKSSAKIADRPDKEAECYHRIGLIHEKMGDLEKAII